MAGSGGDSRSKEAAGMMALHEALHNVCLNSDWTYSVFWTIRPRPRCRGGSTCKVGDDNGSLMLMWEDGFCRTRAEEMMDGGEDPVRKAFSKMSIQLYNYGEGLMGKVASDKCHKWVFKEPSTDCEQANISNYWQSSFDAVPPEWTDQFACGIQTIAVIQAGHGLLQLGSCKIIPEDLHFVLRMRHMFESLGYQSGFFISQLFCSTRNNPSSSTPAQKQPPPPTRPPPLIFNWTGHPPPLPSPTTFHPPANDTHLFLDHTHTTDAHMQEMMIPDHHDESHDLKWPNGLSFFTALTGMNSSEATHLPNRGESSTTEDYLSLEGKVMKMGNGRALKRSFTMPARMTPSTSSSSSLDQQNHAATPQPVGYRGSEAGMYSEYMEILD